MDRTIVKAVYVFLISVGLAVLFNFLFFEKLPGISVVLFAVTLMGTVLLFGRYQKLQLGNTWWLVVLITFFALMPSVRANEFLIFLNLCAILGLLLLWAHQLAGTQALLLRLQDYVILVTLVPLRMLSRAVSTVTLITQIQSNEKHRDVWLRVLKGVLMAVPILIIFGALFSQADLAFSQFIKGFVDITISERTIQYFVLLLFALVASLSFLSYIFFPRRVEAAVADTSSKAVAQPGKGIEVMVFLGLIAALFLLFIGFQITYLFGGEVNIVGAGFTYAEYARRGFWELLAVTLLSLLVLLASEKYARVEVKSDKRFLIPALILIAEVGVIIVSALKRLSLYVDAYGMTTQRLYVAGFILLLLVLFILLAIKFIQVKREQFFAFGTLLSLAAFLIAIDLVNPDAFVARFNTEQYKQTGKLDVSYLGMLSADATPWKIEVYKEASGENKEILRELLEKQKNNLQKNSDNWQSANVSRGRALKLLQVLGE